MSEKSTLPPAPAWTEARTRLQQSEPAFDELEPGGALALALNDDGWILEITPDGRLICQAGMDIEDIQSLLSDGTPEDLGTDELAKQAKYYLQPMVAKFRKPLRDAGFEEQTEMTEQYVAITFQRPVDFLNVDAVMQSIRWCKQHFAVKA
ncbi:MAG: hypothetical protein FJ248_04675 [Nitrospira sp.]|nr:hypothetical protein [Nitrospira sp.]